MLAADDSPVALVTLSSLLESRGYRVVTATNGIVAAEIAYRELPDLIILDIEMPRMSGYHVCRLLKRDPLVANIPVIILTAADHRGIEFWSLKTGADRFMLKSVAPDELISTIETLIANSKPSYRIGSASPGPEELLASVCELMDEELHSATIERIEMKTIVQNLRDGVVTVNLSGDVISTNKALCEMVGREESSLRGKPLAEALGEPAGKVAFEEFCSVLGGNDSSDQESEIEHRSGTKTPVAISTVPLRDFLGGTIGGVCLFHDITRRKELEGIYEKLRTLDKVKNDLTSMIIHDLRTPLTSLLSGLQTLRPTEEDQEILDISVSGGNKLLGMINDLLDISKMEEGVLNLETRRLALAGIVDEALAQVAWLAEDKGLSMSEEISPEAKEVWADADKLRRVLINLLGNAVKFTPTGGRITVTAKNDTARGEIVVGVRDTGEGVPKEAFLRIFDKFGQVESRKAGKSASSGLGLTFCKLVVEAHGGRIWVESEPGLGSTFFFTLPANPLQSGSPSKVSDIASAYHLR